MSQEREISKEFVKHLHNGVLKDFVDVIRKSNGELIMCIRNGYINVYYNTHNVFKIEEKIRDKRFLVLFDAGHTRYTKDRLKKIDKLKEYGVIYNICEKGQPNKKNGLPYKSDKHTFEFYIEMSNSKVNHIKEICEIYIGFIKDFFDENLDYDYIKNQPKGRKKAKLSEKQMQHDLYAGRHTMRIGDDEFILYDIEFKEPGNRHSGKPDFMAARVRKGIVESVVLVELKTESISCNNESGVAEHLVDFEKMIHNTKYGLIPNMKYILNLYKEIGMKPEFKYSPEIKHEILFIFAEDSKNWIKNNNGVLPDSYQGIPVKVIEI